MADKISPTLALEDKKASDKYVPEGFDTVEDFLRDMREEYEKDVDFDEENRRQAVEDKKFAAGDQWDQTVRDQRKGLPCLVINSVPQFIAQLVGDWRENKRAVKVLPDEDGDKDVADVRADLIRSIETQSRADRVYDNAFESAVTCGDGAFRIAVEYARNNVFDQDLFVRGIDDAQSVVWDRMSTDPTGRDAKRCFVDDLIPTKEFERTWKDSKPSELGRKNYNTMTAGGWINADGVKVTEYWRLIERDRLLTLFDDGSVRFVENNLDALIKKHGAAIKSRTSPVTYAQMHLVTGFDILSGPYEYQLSRLPIIRVTGRTINIEGNRIRYGLVRFMKDSVRLRNFWRSVAAEAMGMTPKAQWIAPESAVEGREDEFRKAHLTRDPLLIYNDDATTPPERVQPAPFQAALHQEAETNVQDMKDVTGIHDASLGIKSNETSGKAINARQREGDIASVTYYDNGNAAVLEGGDVMNQLISQIYDGTRTIRIIGEDEKIKFMRINDPGDIESPDLSVGTYDVALSSGSSYTTRRVEAAQAMMDAVQVWPQLIGVAGDLVAKAQDWPGAEELSERLKKTIPPQYLDPDEREGIDPATQQLTEEVQKLMMENQSMKMDRSIDVAKLKIDQYNAETQRIRALSDNEVDGNNIELAAIKQIVDHGINIHGAMLAEDQQNHQQDMATQQQEMAQDQQDHAQGMDQQGHELAVQGQADARAAQAAKAQAPKAA